MPMIPPIMSPSGKRTAVSSLEALRRKVNLETLAHLQPLMLLQMVVGVSQTVNEGVSSSQALARTLLLSGQQRLRELMDAAPRLHLPVARMLELCRADDTGRTPEEAAAQALFELCLGLMLHWMAEAACHCSHIAQWTRRSRDAPVAAAEGDPRARGWKVETQPTTKPDDRRRSNCSP
jgi:hypothetical protein